MRRRTSHRSRFLVCFMANQKGRGASPSPIGAASLFFHGWGPSRGLYEPRRAPRSTVRSVRSITARVSQVTLSGAPLCSKVCSISLANGGKSKIDSAWNRLIRHAKRWFPRECVNRRDSMLVLFMYLLERLYEKIFWVCLFWMVNEIVEIVAFLIIFLERIYGFIKWRIENNNDVSPMDRR